MKDFTISGPDWFDGAAEPVVLLREGTIVYCNAAAQRLGLTAGEALPEVFGGLEGGAVSGVQWQGRAWQCRCAAVSGGMLLQLEQQRQAEFSADRLGQLAAKMRVPLGNLIGAIQLLEYPRTDRSEEKTRQYQAIERKNYHILLRMLDDLELLSGLEDGQSFRPVVLDFGGLCGEVTRSAQALAQQAGRALELEAQDGNLLVQGEAHLLRRMLYHLISNALRSCGDGGKVCLHLEKQGKFVRLTVSDTGRGFAPQDLGTAFEAAQGEELLSGGGLGIGIPLCRQVVQRHGGRIALLSGSNGGKVVVELPLAQSVEGGTLHSWVDPTGGINEVLTRLSDVLPWQCFTEEE